MNEIVEFFNTVLEGEINRWSGFHRALRKDDREAFEELLDMFRSYASEISCATNPIAFEPLVMSIAIFQQKRIIQLEKKLQVTEPRVAKSTENNPPAKSESKLIIKQASRGGGQTRLA